MNSQRRNLLILSFTLAVVMIGYGIILPIIPYYIEEMGAGGREMGLLTAISALMQFIFAPMWGSLSDRYGRKPILIIGMLGYGITMLLFGLATQLWMLFLAQALNGVLSSAAMPTAMAYIGDQTPGKERGRGMGQLGAAMGAGVVLGPGIGGALASASLSTPFFVASGLCMVALLLVWFVLPESLTVEARTAQKQSRSVLNIGLMRQALGGSLGVFMLLSFVVSFGLSSFQGILGLFALDKFGLTTQQTGWLWVIIGAVMIVSQGVLTGWLTQRLGETVVVRLSLAATTFGFGLMLLPTAYLPLLLATGFLMLSISLLGPALNALISTRTRFPQGITMGLSNSATSLGRIIGPLWAGVLYDFNLHFPFISGAVILLAGFLISMVWITAEEQPAPAVEQTYPQP